MSVPGNGEVCLVGFIVEDQNHEYRDRCSNLLVVANNKIQFLIRKLLDSCRFHESPIDASDPAGSHYWFLEFFDGWNGRKKSFAVVWRTMGYETFTNPKAIEKNKPAGNELARVVWLPGKDGPGATRDVSLALRGTATLSADEFEEDADRLYCVDPRGFGMTAKAYQATHFERGALLLCLARAYIRAFDDLADTVVDVAAMSDAEPAESDAEQASAARMAFSAIARFGAQYWFAHPVEPEKYSLIKVWRLISSTFNLDSRAKELQSQSHALSHVLGEIEREIRLQEDREAANRKKRFSWIVSAFGTVVAILSLLDLLRTPWLEWQRIITGWFG